MVLLFALLTEGIGLTVTVALIGVPTQNVGAGPVGVIVYVMVTGTGGVVEFVKVAPVISPDPLVSCEVEIPVGEFLVHAKVVPVTELVRTIVALAVPEQIDWACGVAVTSGMGSTTTGIQSDMAGPQPTPD
jgi:hypothetical protein